MKRWQITVGALVLVVLLAFLLVPLIYAWTTASPDRLLERRLADANGVIRAEDLEGRWRVDPTGSVVGYRVGERIGLANVDAVGRTSDVSGEFEVVDGTLVTGVFEADMNTVVSDRSQRDDQFRTRIMDVETYPTAQFVLTRELRLPLEIEIGSSSTVSLIGELTLRGETREVEIGVVGGIDDGRLRLTGETVIVFSDWEIPNPSLPAAMIFTDSSGLLEIDLYFVPVD